MKSLRLFLPVVLLVMSSGAIAQSDSFQTLKDKFGDDNDVHCFKVSGLFCRAVLWIGGEWELKEAISDVNSIRLITIPKGSFSKHDLSIAGFRKFIAKDHFEFLAQVRDEGDRVEVYLQESGNHRNRYLVLVEEAAELTVIEVKGFIDIQKMREIENRKNISYQVL